MSNPLAFVRRAHRFNLRHLVYPLVLSSLLALALFAGRVYLSRGQTYRFLVWNLFLAWIPYLGALLIALIHARHPRAWWLLIVPGALWLLFLPNAPYLVTDLWHLDERHPVPLWYDIGMLATFAWSGIFLGVASLSAVQDVIARILGRAFSWLFALGVIGLSGFGIYLGRFLNWNSWDLFFEPQMLARDIATRLAHPFRYLQMYGVTLLFAAFMLVCYLTFKSVEHRETEPINR
jgi:uncharacterized membrane protein